MDKPIDHYYIQYNSRIKYLLQIARQFIPEEKALLDNYDEKIITVAIADYSYLYELSHEHIWKHREAIRAKNIEEFNNKKFLNEITAKSSHTEQIGYIFNKIQEILHKLTDKQKSNIFKLFDNMVADIAMIKKIKRHNLLSK